MKSVTKQLEEFQLLRSCLLPSEHFVFDKDGDNTWAELLEKHSDMLGGPEAFHVPEDILPADVRINVSQASGVYIRIQVPLDYSGNFVESPPIVSVKGDVITRLDQERWNALILERWKEVDPGTEYPIYELISSHLLPLLHAEVETRSTPLSSAAIASASVSPNGTTYHPDNTLYYHALLTSHHLISPQKRRSLQTWSSSLSVSGFAKVGYPGIIYAQGQKENVEEFVDNVKAMQWLALRVRFVEPLLEIRDGGMSTVDVEVEEGGWLEFEKVGEVMQEVRRMGRERFFVEMGIGSLGPAK